uniref:SH2 domain-containing protein n=1 Tax=Trichogramma kaykai TaxID=54128 RepID=A0ABD2W7T8_9HYME
MSKTRLHLELQLRTEDRGTLETSGAVELADRRSMCRSGHTLSQCLGVASLQEECAAEPTYGFGAEHYQNHLQYQQHQHQLRQAKQQNRSTRRFARRRRTFAAFTAIMGRLGRVGPSSIARTSLFKVHYRKLDEDHSPVKHSRIGDHRHHHHHNHHHQLDGKTAYHRLKIITPVPAYMTSCCRCGHTQKLKNPGMRPAVGRLQPAHGIRVRICGTDGCIALDARAIASLTRLSEQNNFMLKSTFNSYFVHDRRILTIFCPFAHFPFLFVQDAITRLGYEYLQPRTYIRVWVCYVRSYCAKHCVRTIVNNKVKANQVHGGPRKAQANKQDDDSRGILTFRTRVIASNSLSFTLFVYTQTPSVFSRDGRGIFIMYMYRGLQDGETAPPLTTTHVAYNAHYLQCVCDCKSLSNSDTANNNHPINCKWETSNDKQQQLHNHHHHHHHHSNSASSGSVSSDECSSSSATNSSTSAEMNLQLGSSASPTLRLSSVKTPNSIPGLRPAHDFGTVLTQLSQNGVGCSSGVGGVGGVGSSSSSSSSNNNNNNNNKINHHEDNLGKSSQQSTPSSEESNSPTELNSYKRLGDKPPLIKRLAMGFTGRDVLGLNSEEDSCPLVVSGGSTPNSPTTQRPQSGGYINEAIIDSENLRLQAGGVGHYGKIPPGVDPKSLTFENARTLDADYKKRPSASAGGLGIFMTPSPPPLPERYDSLNARAEENELKKAPWFQAGIPREITLEVLSQEPEGAFMVRESTSKPGCYALSLRVPRDFQPSGIAHYLIMRTQKGYKIKGFTKEFTTLTSLITHHSVMPELLPCPLSLSRYNPSYAKSKDTFNDDDEIDSDPDYTTLADFRKMMADLNV